MAQWDHSLYEVALMYLYVTKYPSLYLSLEISVSLNQVYFKLSVA